MLQVGVVFARAQLVERGADVLQARGEGVRRQLFELFQQVGDVFAERVVAREEGVFAAGFDLAAVGAERRDVADEAVVEVEQAEGVFLLRRVFVRFAVDVGDGAAEQRRLFVRLAADAAVGEVVAAAVL